jgi:hypothetical protein
MNEYLSRNEISPVDRVTRTVAAISSVPAAPQGGDTDTAVQAKLVAKVAASTSGDADIASSSEEQLASAAEYARIHARIADILAGMRSDGTAPVSSASNTEADIVSLLPAPVIIIPLPPASKDMVERAEMLAKDIAVSASLTRAAQAHVKPGTVDQILATAA